MQFVQSAYSKARQRGDSASLSFVVVITFLLDLKLSLRFLTSSSNCLAFTGLLPQLAVVLVTNCLDFNDYVV